TILIRQVSATEILSAFSILLRDYGLVALNLMAFLNKTSKFAVQYSRLNKMSIIQRSIQVGFELRVFFTRNVFASANPLLRDILAGPVSDPLRNRRALVVMDEALAEAQPALSGEIEAYFANIPRLNLVCAPLVIEGGERTKNSYFHVSEIHSQIDRYHIDRHSYLLALGGG